MTQRTEPAMPEMRPPFRSSEHRPTTREAHVTRMSGLPVEEQLPHIHGALVDLTNGMQTLRSDVASQIGALRSDLQHVQVVAREARDSSTDLESQTIASMAILKQAKDAEIKTIQDQNKEQIEKLDQVVKKQAERDAEEAATKKLKAEADEARAKRRDALLKWIAVSTPVLAILSGLITALIATAHH